MTYWLDLFTGETWEEFRRAGAKIAEDFGGAGAAPPPIVAFRGESSPVDLHQLANVFLALAQRPTFSFREKPLPRVCGFVSFEKLMEQVEGIRRLGLATSLKPEFLKNTAEYFNDDEG